ncbi:RDD family protein [Halobacterium zhouii]|uniref:RDD family protein n=1 Tax=Halobacterium zhouii TaxID=2902624 RepID=UPI001E429651|nr:RDD family protein [Halobacterium zhouii]
MSGYSKQPDRDDTDIIGSRIGAQLVDSIIMVVLFFIGSFIGGLVGGFIGAFAGSDGIAGGATLLGILVGIAAALFYAFLLEGAWDGYTVGKRVFGIKVVKETGETLDYGAAFVRNLLRIIDGLFYYVVGFIAMAASDKRQRIGDRVAGTVVVREEN